MVQSKRILFCPLDWGLGHATRTIPVIREFERRGCVIIIASSGSCLELLKQEFPKALFFTLPAYAPQYQNMGLMSLAMLRQLPKFKRVINAEHTAVGKIVEENNIDLIVSDNRYGCWSPRIKSVFITHQINLLMPRGFAWMSAIMNSLLHSFIRKFHEIWVPDDPEVLLTKPFLNKSFNNQKFIGWLSRFDGNTFVQHEYDIVALVSGPEPQRSSLETILIHQLKDSGLKSLLVTGQPGLLRDETHAHMRILNHLSADDLQQAILSASMVIARSGYSTVMDLIALRRCAIFVPTPQQPEQIFFAEYLNKNGIVYSVEQQNFSLVEALEKAKQYKGFSFYKFDRGLLMKAIDSILK